MRLLGKKPARFDKRTLKLSDYLVKLPSPPDSVSWTAGIPSWPMMGNDTLGDCVEAAMGHMVEEWSHFAGQGSIPSDQAVITAYSGIGGYVPGDPSTDQGSDMLTALNYWRKTGIAGHKILAFVALNTQNLVELQTAMWLFGNAFIGIQLPLSVHYAESWSVPQHGTSTPAGAIGGWGGHCVPVVGGNPLGTTVVTWGQTMFMSRNFYKVYADEAYAVLSQDWLNRAGFSPANFNLAQLKADLQSITTV
jgi:hypothetical protein